MKIASRRGVEGAGHVAAEADLLLLGLRVGDGHGGKEGLGIRVVRRIVDFLRRPDLHDAAQVHHGDVVGEVAHHAQVMGDEDHGGAEGLLDLQQQVDHRRLHRHVQGGHRLVADDQVRPAGQGPGDAHPLLLAAGQLPRQPVVVGRREAHRLEQADHLVFDLHGRHGLEAADGPGDLPAHGVRGVEGRVRVLEHHLHLLDQVRGPFRDRLPHLDVHELHLAAAQRLEPDQPLDQGRLAAARLPHQPQRAPLGNPEADIVHRLDELLFPQAEQAGHRIGRLGVPDLQVLRAQHDTGLRFARGDRLDALPLGLAAHRLGLGVDLQSIVAAGGVIGGNLDHGGAGFQAFTGGVIAPRRKDAGVPGPVGRRGHPAPDGIEHRIRLAFPQLGHGGDQPPGVGMAGAGEDFHHRSFFHHLAGVHHAEEIADPGHHPQVVGDEDVGGVEIPLQLLDQVEHRRLHGDVQGRGGLVHDQQCRVVEHGHGDDHPLLLTA